MPIRSLRPSHVPHSPFPRTQVYIKDVDGATLTQVGTPMYIAPEVLVGDQHYTNKADTFSFGLVVLHTMAALEHGGIVGCWGGQQLGNGIGVRMAMGQRPLIPTALSQGLPELSTLVKQCWDMEPVARPDFAEIVLALRRATSKGAPHQLAERGRGEDNGCTELAANLADGEPESTQRIVSPLVSSTSPFSEEGVPSTAGAVLGRANGGWWRSSKAASKLRSVLALSPYRAVQRSTLRAAPSHSGTLALR